MCILWKHLYFKASQHCFRHVTKLVHSFREWPISKCASVRVCVIVCIIISHPPKSTHFQTPTLARPTQHTHPNDPVDAIRRFIDWLMVLTTGGDVEKCRRTYTHEERDDCMMSVIIMLVTLLHACSTSNSEKRTKKTCAGHHKYRNHHEGARTPSGAPQAPITRTEQNYTALPTHNFAFSLCNIHNVGLCAWNISA